MKRGARVVVLALVAVVALVSLPATWARSANPCSECHSSTRYQYLDLLEGNQGNLIPASMSVGETRIVTVVVQNLC